MRTSKNQRDLAVLVLGESRSELLAILLLHPEQGFYVRELGRRTGRSVGTLHRELATLVDAGLLSRSKDGNQVRYRANMSCPVYPELASFLRKTAGLGDVLRSALAPLRSRFVFAAVFGSMASGTASMGSDVDILIVGDASFGEVVVALAPAQETLGRDVNPVVITAQALQEKIRAKDSFYERVLSGPLIPLEGNTDDLGELAQAGEVARP